jgi:hypothetical protein
MKLDEGDADHQNAPWSKFVQQMGQIKIERLRSMDCFAKSRNKFAHYNLIKKAGLKEDAADYP